MKMTLGVGVLLVVTAMAAACSVKMFEDVGNDPHPPTVEIKEIILYVPPSTATPEPTPEPTPPPDPAAAMIGSSAQGRSISWNSGGFTLSQGEKFQIGLAYTDAGGDIEKFPLRDLDGPLKMDCIPFELTYMSGISGTAVCVMDGFELAGMLGRHRLELWAEDSHGSRSEKVEFVITLAP